MILLNIDVGTIALVCIAMVFLILFFLTAIYLMLPKMLDIYFNKKLIKEGKLNLHVGGKRKMNEEPIEGNVNAAIAMALYLHNSDVHIEESNIITIEDVRRAYSPWRSKIYGVMNYPKR